MAGQLVPRGDGEVVELSAGQLTIGRRRTCDVVIDDSSVSGRHAEVELIDGSWFLTDCGSTNGTFVNGERCESTVRLKDEDVVAFFKLEYVFEFEEPTLKFKPDAAGSLGGAAGTPAPSATPLSIPDDAAIAPEPDLQTKPRSDVGDDDEEFRKPRIGADGNPEISVYKLSELLAEEAKRDPEPKPPSGEFEQESVTDTVDQSVEKPKRRSRRKPVAPEPVDEPPPVEDEWDDEEEGEEEEASAYRREVRALPRVGRTPDCFVRDQATPETTSDGPPASEGEYVGVGAGAVLLAVVVAFAAAQFGSSGGPPDSVLASVITSVPLARGPARPGSTALDDPDDPERRDPGVEVAGSDPRRRDPDDPPRQPDGTDTLPPIAADEVMVVVNQLKEIQKAEAGGRDVAQLAQLMQAMAGKEITIDPDDPNWIRALREGAGGKPNLSKLGVLKDVLREIEAEAGPPTQADVRDVRNAVSAVLGAPDAPNPKDRTAIVLRLSEMVPAKLEQEDLKELVDIVQKSTGPGGKGLAVGDARAFADVLSGVAGLDSPEGLDGLTEATGLLEQLTGQSAGNVLGQLLDVEGTLARQSVDQPQAPGAVDPVAELARLRQLEVYAVGPGGDFPNLKAGLAGLPSKGAVVALVGNKSFVASEVEIRGGVVVLTPAGDGTPKISVTGRTGFRLGNGELQFRGIDVERTSPVAGGSVVEAVGGQVGFTGCRVRVVGDAAQACVRVGASANGTVRTRFTSSFVRGDALSAVATETGRFELAAADTLFVAGRAPLVTANVASGKGGAANVRLVGSTVAAAPALVDVSGPAAARVTLGLLAIETILARDGANGPLVDARGTRVAANWQLSKDVLVRWDGLLRQDGRVLAKTLPELERLGNARVERSRLADVNWPPGTAGSGSSSPALRYRQDVLRSQLEIETKLEAGCDVARFAEGDTAPAVPIAVAGRPKVPAGVVQTKGTPHQVDLTKTDLGRYLSATKLPDGAHVVASGAGPVRCSPFAIDGRSLKLEIAAGATPVVLVPYVESSDEPLMTVRNGSLELVNVTVLTDRRTTAQLPGFPTWYVRVVDGSLALRGCRLLGPTVRGSTARNHSGLVDWQRSTRAAALLQAGGAPYDEFLVVENTFLGGTGTLVRADGRGRAIFLRNVVGTSRGDLFELQIGGFGPRISSCVDVSGSTLAAKRALFTISTRALDQPCPSPLRFFVDRTVFGPPMREPSGTPDSLLVHCPKFALDERQLLWEGRRNAYSSAVTRFVDSEYDSSSKQSFESAWVRRWGAGHVVEALHGERAVEMRAQLEIDLLPEPVHFELAPRSTAASHDDGRPIGADPTRIVKTNGAK